MQEELRKSDTTASIISQPYLLASHAVRRLRQTRVQSGGQAPALFQVPISDVLQQEMSAKSLEASQESLRSLQQLHCGSGHAPG